ncbi:MAG TPA: hypothetical protein VFI52_11190 [Gemmatimonadaceae bacterium]|nr:hypothetical protein [Gemmatimonadaceae bacterium]
MKRLIRPSLGVSSIALVLIAALSRGAVAQTSAYAAGVGDTTLDVSLVRVIDGASARGIPSAPLLAKVREGRLKRANTARIRSALASLVARLDSARAALGPAASTDELVAGADAFAAGADATAVRAVRAASAGRPVSAPLGALAQLVASGVPGPRAVAMVVELLRRNASPAQVLAFGNSVESDVVSGLPAEEAAVLRLHSFGVNAGDALTFPQDMPATIRPGNLNTTTTPPPQKTPKRRP